jgi:hypothetical protein
MDDQERFYRIHSGRGLYYGLAKCGSTLYVACRGTTDGAIDASARAQENGSILVFDAHALTLKDELYPDGFRIRDAHGLACIDGKLFVACSYDNLIAIFDFATSRWEKWYPAIDMQARDRDIHHLNSIAVHEDKIVVLAHNKGPSHLLFYDPRTLDLCRVAQLGHHAHDIFRIGGELGVCSSAEGLLVSKQGWQLRTGGFPRGVEITEDAILVGISHVAERTNRNRVSSLVRRFSRTWLHTCDYVLEGVGMVLDILSLEIDEDSLARLEPFRQVRRFPGQYNEAMPGNVYAPGAAKPPVDVFTPEWHAPEGMHRWTAAREARMTIVANPGETTISVTALSAFPGLYHVEIYMGVHYLGRIEWTRAGQRTASFALPPGTRVSELVFRVPHLWQPSKCLQGAEDGRSLGTGVVAVTLQ